MTLTGRDITTGRPIRLDLAGPHIAAVVPVDAAPDLWIAPGFIDLQVNGFGGHDMNSGRVTSDDVAQLAAAVWRSGVTRFYPTLITQSEDSTLRALRAIADACESDPLLAHAIPCVHVEGPFISPVDGPRGAHPLQHVRPPDLAEYHRWQEAARGRVGLVTVAPEQPGALDFIRAVSTKGVVVALGHHAADTAHLHAAVDAGARMSTHLGNGAHGQLPRHPNYIWDQLAEDRLIASFIFDGHHLPAAVMRVALRAKGLDRTVLVSDAVALAGMPPGVYDTPVGGKVELHPNGRLNLYGTQFLAGSATPLPVGVANAVTHAGATLAQAVVLITVNPARFLPPASNHDARLAPGAPADLTLFHFRDGDPTLTIDQTIVRGATVYRRA